MSAAVFVCVFADEQDKQKEIEEAASPAQLIRQYDQNDDENLSRGEFYFGRRDDGPQEGELPLAPEHDRLFHEVDSNCDGLLDESEIRFYDQRHLELAYAAEAERRLRDVKLPTFREMDADGDQLLSLDEWRAGEAATADTKLLYEFRLCDFDEDGALSFMESVCTSLYGDAVPETGLPDPIRAEMERVYTGIVKALSDVECDQSQYSFDKVLTVVKDELPFLQDLSQWDRDGDRLLGRNEIRYGLESALGIRRQDGMLLRRPNGQVFNLKTYGYMDLNDNQELSRAEFLEKYWSKDTAVEMFEKVDLNSDDVVTLSELSTSYLGHLFWVDTLSDFRRFDQDEDARISPDEMAKTAKYFEANQAMQVFPSFDVDRDGFLSLAEFRATPFGCPILDWNRTRWDQNHDGRLSLEEYHGDEMQYARGLAHLFLIRLDHNGDGMLARDETDLNINWGKVARETAFDALDANGDGQLSWEEVVAPFERPPGDRPDWYHKKLIRLEDAFIASDGNGNYNLSKEEYMAPQSAISETVAGRLTSTPLRQASASPSRSYSRPETSPSKVAAAQPRRNTVSGAGVASTSDDGWNWPLIGFVLFDVFALTGAAWYFLYARSKKSE